MLSILSCRLRNPMPKRAPDHDSDRYPVAAHDAAALSAFPSRGCGYMMAARDAGRQSMRRRAGLLAIVLIGCAVGTSATAALAGGKIRLAQSSSLTNCMMTCNSQAATCLTTCLVPGTPPTGAATATSNATLNTACQVNCSIQRISCQTTCSQSFPPQ
jgi:hypothetical protein